MRITRKSWIVETFSLITIIIFLIPSIHSLTTWSPVNCPALCVCTYIPSKWVNETVKRVDCSMKGLKLIPRNIPSECQSLILTGNRIGDIHQTISMLGHLIELDLSSNSINQVGRGHIFFNLSHLRHLNISFNGFKTLFPGVFRGLKRLEKLYLTNGQLKYIDEHAFDGLENLRELHLQDNQLSSIFLELFQSIFNLHVLNLDGNSITHLTGGIFASLSGLRILKASRNHLTVIDDNALVGLGSLEDMNLSDNRLTNVPSIALQSLKRIKRIDLSGNPFACLGTGDFVHIPVREISVNRCYQLVMVERMAFWDLPELTTIYLQSNRKLEFIDPQAFLGVPRLNHLYLDGNSLLTLESDLVNNIVHRGHNQLLTISMTSNPFLCDCNIHFLYQCLHSGNSSKVNLVNSDQLKCSQPKNLSLSIKDLNIDSISSQCPPTILSSSVSPSNLTLHRKIGEKVVFQCRALGQPPPKTYWILPNGETFNETTSSSPHIILKNPTVLRMFHLRPTDSGRYTCIAENPVGQAQISFQLVVDNIQVSIWPLGVSSTFVSVVWNGTSASSSSSSSGRRSSLPEYQILYKDEDDPSDKFETISVGHFLRSYTINHLEPQKRYKLCIAVRDEEANNGYVQLSCTLVQTSGIARGYEMLETMRNTSNLALAWSFSIITVVLVGTFSMSILGARRYRQRQYETPQKSLVNNMASSIPLAQLPLVSNQLTR